MDEFEKFLTEKQKLEEFLDKLDEELTDSLEDFETVSLDKLNDLLALVIDNETYAFTIGKKLYKDYIKFENKFKTYANTFEEEKRFTLETTLDDFLNDIQILRKDLFEVK